MNTLAQMFNNNAYLAFLIIALIILITIALIFEFYIIIKQITPSLFKKSERKNQIATINEFNNATKNLLEVLKDEKSTYYIKYKCPTCGRSVKSNEEMRIKCEHCDSRMKKE